MTSTEAGGGVRIRSVASRGYRRIRFWVATAVATALVLFLIPVGVLSITREGSGGLLWRVLVGNGSQVELRYTNSRYNAPTIQRYIVADGLLRLVEISSTSASVLEFLVLERPYELRGGQFVSKRRGPSFEVLTVRIGETERQTLVVNGREVPLYRVGVGETVRVTMSRMPRALALLRRPQSP